MTREMLKRQLCDPEQVLPNLKQRQREQKLKNDKTAKELPPLRNGEFVRQQVEACLSYRDSAVT